MTTSAYAHAGKVLHVENFYRYEDTLIDNGGMIDTTGLEFLCIHWSASFAGDGSADLVVRGANYPIDGFLYSAVPLTPVKIEGNASIGAYPYLVDMPWSGDGAIVWYKEMPRYLRIAPSYTPDPPVEGEPEGTLQLHVFGWIV